MKERNKILFCPNCGKNLEIITNFCSDCGFNLAEFEGQQNQTGNIFEKNLNTDCLNTDNSIQINNILREEIYESELGISENEIINNQKQDTFLNIFTEYSLSTQSTKNILLISIGTFISIILFFSFYGFSVNEIVKIYNKNIGYDETEWNIPKSDKQTSPPKIKPEKRKIKQEIKITEQQKINLESQELEQKQAVTYNTTNKNIENIQTNK